MFLINSYLYTAAPSWSGNTYSVIMDGVDEYGKTSPIDVLESASAFTVSFWMKSSSLGAADVLGGYYNGLAADWLMWEHWFSNNFRMRFKDSGGTEAYGYTGTSKINTGSWQHICIVYDGGGVANADRLKIYINNTNETLTFSGTIPATTAAYDGSTNASNTYGFALGKQGAENGASNFSPASFDEVAIFDYALTSTQVGYVYNSAAPADLSNTTGLTAPTQWWRCGDAAGDTNTNLDDVGTGTGYNMTLINMESGDLQTDVP